MFCTLVQTASHTVLSFWGNNDFADSLKWCPGPHPNTPEHLLGKCILSAADKGWVLPWRTLWPSWEEPPWIKWECLGNISANTRKVLQDRVLVWTRKETPRSLRSSLAKVYWQGAFWESSGVSLFWKWPGYWLPTTPSVLVLQDDKSHFLEGNWGPGFWERKRWHRTWLHHMQIQPWLAAILLVQHVLFAGTSRQSL